MGIEVFKIELEFILKAELYQLKKKQRSDLITGIINHLTHHDFFPLELQHYA